MQAVFGQDGATVGWRRGDVVHALDGRAIGFVFNRALFTRSGQYAGRFEDDVYRDARGRIIGFEREATGGPLLPVPLATPIQPVHELRPPVPSFETAPRAPMRAMAWSDSTFEGIFIPASVPSA